MLVDTSTTLTEALAIHDDVRQIAGRDVTHVVLTHKHFDHVLGSGEFVELANLRTAFGWAADNDQLDVAVGIACLAGLLGVWVEHYEPVSWAEELVRGPACAVDHKRLPQLYVLASECYAADRIDDAVAYTENLYAGVRVHHHTSTRSPRRRYLRVTRQRRREYETG